MSKPPWFKFYSADWLVSPEVRILTLKQRGLFIDMIAASWQQDPPGTLPANKSEFCAILGLEPRRVLAKNGPEVGHFLGPNLAQLWPKVGERLVNKKMMKISEELEKARDRQSKSGKEGAAKRWGGHSNPESESESDTEEPIRSVARSDKKPPPAPRSKLPKLSDQEYLDSLGKNTAYSHIDIPRELAKMDSWIAVNPRRKKTRRFVVNWLNKIDPPMNPANNGNNPHPNPNREAIDDARRKLYPDKA